MYYFDTANSNCYSGVLTHTSGSWELSGPIIAKFNQGTYLCMTLYVHKYRFQ